VTTQWKILVTGATGKVGGQLTTQFTPQPVTDAVYEITGRVPRPLHQWTLDHAEAFR
jgi:uncharacterized protein YbjT (DUF2867 family)